MVLGLQSLGFKDFSFQNLDFGMINKHGAEILHIWPEIQGRNFLSVFC